MTAVPALPATAPPPAGNGRIHTHFPAAAGGAPTPVDDEPGSGYRELELLVSSASNVYRYGATTDEIDLADADLGYTTRLVVRRPTDPARFSGTAVLTVTHPEVGAGPLWPFAGPYLRATGDAHILVITRRNRQAYGEATSISQLKKFDPRRYAALDLADGGLSWDIIAQVAGLLRSSATAKPLHDLDVRRVLTRGYSGA